MRLSKTVTIGKRAVTVYEVAVKDLINLPELPENINDIEGRADEFLNKACDLTFNEIKEMYPSEIKQVWDAFQEVNSVLFGLAAKAGLQEAITKTIAQHFNAAFVA